jgi:uncharacterized lipoprotein YmbA
MRMLPLLIVVVVLQSACSLGGPSQPSRFYALSVHAGQPLTTGSALPGSGIGVGPVSLPELYERPQLVTRPADNLVELAEFERWGGNLAEDVKRVLVQDLIGRLGSDNILVWPWQRQETPALQVAVQFFRFDGEPGEQARLSGLWQLFDAVEGCRLEVHRFDISRVPGEPGYTGYVGALSLALAQLSQDIAGRLAVVRPGCHSSRG